mmetsp:Transcript_96/g.186  ORF Transcript_96/g.186 Transcript_96/m.186 type:complete len:229 (-) Transcript_96:124-810(-)
MSSSLKASMSCSLSVFRPEASSCRLSSSPSSPSSSSSPSMSSSSYSSSSSSSSSLSGVSTFLAFSCSFYTFLGFSCSFLASLTSLGFLASSSFFFGIFLTFSRASSSEESSAPFFWTIWVTLEELIFSCLTSSFLTSSAFLMSWPHLTTVTSFLGLSLWLVGSLSSFLMTSWPFSTLPKTTCFPSKWGVLVKVMKNWLPFVFLPALAIERRKGSWCLSLKFSSLNLLP